MSKKSWWDSPFWKAIGALAALVTIIGFLLQIFGKVDVYNLLIVPIINVFTFPVPLFSIPLAFLVVIGFLFVWASLRDKSADVTVDNPLARADFLDSNYVRALALLCKTPRTTEYLKQKYHEICDRLGIYRGYTFEYCLKELEERRLLIFQDGNWKITQKSLDYITKYHGG